jgi:hypothetical protein
LNVHMISRQRQECIAILDSTPYFGCAARNGLTDRLRVLDNMIEFPLRPGGSPAAHRAGATFLGRIGGNAVEDAAPRFGEAAGVDSVAAGAFRLVAPNIGPPWSAWTVPGLGGASTLLAAAAVVPSQSERRAVVSGGFDRSPRSSRSTVASLLRSDVLHRWIAVGAGFGSAGASLKDDGSI